LTDIHAQLQSEFIKLNDAFMAELYLAIDKRIKLLKTIKSRLIENEQALVAVTSKDFGYRTEFDTVLGDLLPTVKSLTDTIKRLPKWQGKITNFTLT
jgi:coniferyl-aldehyde dehydrogenase